MGDYQHQPAASSNQAATTTVLLSKKSLCVIYGKINRTGRCDYVGLRKKVLTDAVLQAAQLDPADVWQRGCRQFDAAASLRLKAVLQIQ